MSPRCDRPCDCCAGVAIATPADVTNRPGLSKLDYRVGTHGSVLASMIARVSMTGHPRLSSLTARTADDPFIALLDAWATVADVLTFYQERIANEGYLRTATERRSIMELGRLVGWVMRPGLSATVYLAYTVDPDPQDPDADRLVTIPRGSKAQNVPDQGQLPQTFETADALEARAWWNDLGPRLRRPMLFLPADIDGLEVLYLSGVELGLAPNDPILLAFRSELGPPEIVRVASIEVDRALEVTTVGLQASDSPRAGELADELRRTIEEATANASSATAERIAREHLEPLAAKVSPATKLLALANRLALTLEGFDRAVAAEPSRFNRFHEWAIEVHRTLEEVLQRVRERSKGHARALATPLLGERGGDTTAVRLEPDRATGQAVVTPSPQLVSVLKRPASLQPAGAHALERTVERQFAPGSDLANQLLVALDDRLGSSLYKALASIEVGADDQLDAVAAFRVTAQPFGATAPRRPLLDGRGAIVGSEEWPLTGELILEVRTSLEREFSTAQGMVERDGETFLGEVDLFRGDTLTLGGIDLTPNGDEIGKLDVSGEMPDHTMGFGRSPANGPEVTFDDGDGDGERNSGEVWHPFPGQVIRRSVGSMRRSLSYIRDREGRGDAVLTVAERVPLPPDPADMIDLDAEYPTILRGSWVIIAWEGTEDGGRDPVVTRVRDVSTVAVTRYGISAKVTRLELEKPWLDAGDLLLSSIRGVVVHALSDDLTLADEPIPDDIRGSTIELARLYDGLKAGRWVIVEGERTDIPDTSGVRGAELAMLSGTIQSADPSRPGDRIHTTLLLARPLAYSYLRATAVVHGNVVKATHGETRDEVLGSGDASERSQSFTLKAKALTYLPALSGIGAESALVVRVDSVRWRETASPLVLGPRDRGYLVRTTDDDTATVAFGDGVHGARPATGMENIVAKYRTGVGRPGNVPHGRVSQLGTRPLGVSAVVNPLPAAGGADRESRDQARRNVPLAVHALERLVSVPDYEDFARARAGIGQASARMLYDGRRHLVHLTIAGVDDAPIAETSDQFRTLAEALASAGDPQLPFVVQTRESAVLVIAARVRIDPDRLFEEVEPRIRRTLLESFGFDARVLGQSVLLAEVQAAIHGVPGVVYVDVDVLGSVPQSITETPDELTRLAQTLGLPTSGRVAVQLARFDPSVGELRPAQLALLTPDIPDTLILTELEP